MTKKKLASYFIILLFVAYSIWWLKLTLTALPDDPARNFYSDSYGILAGFGGILGLFISKKWGGFKSLVGKSIIFFSLGLLFQFLGQLSYTLEFYIYSIENSYPSYGEIFFLASIPAYILGVWYIAYSSGFAISLKSIQNKLWTTLLPLLMMGSSYYFFIHGTDLSEMSVVEKSLSILYPLGQAVFVSLAVLTCYLTRNVLGGVMRKRVIFILFSLIFQYVADSVFIYRTTFGTWYAADSSEYMFVASYFLMAMALIEFLNVLDKLKKVESR